MTLPAMLDLGLRFWILFGTCAIECFIAGFLLNGFREFRRCPETHRLMLMRAENQLVSDRKARIRSITSGRPVQTKGL